MFSLIYPLTTEASINKESYDIDMSFDTVLRLIEMLSDRDLDDVTQVETGIHMLFGEVDWDLHTKSTVLQTIFNEAITKDSIEAQEYDIQGNPMPSETNSEEPSYSLIEDAEYIYASFMQVYKMDLIEHQGTLHWDKFKALLGGLTDDCIFKQVINIRTEKLPTGKGTSEERARMIKMKKMYALKGVEIDGDES